jgi:Xaa-Pro aminopeptidase
MRIAYLLQQVGMTDITFVPGENIFRRIRVVKSPVELGLMRIAGENNSKATEIVMRSITPGMTVPEIEHLFAVEAAKLGNTSVTFLPGMAVGGFPDGKAVKGKSFAVDAVSSFRQYHGDCGRTLVIGEPSKEIKARAKAHRAGYDEIYAKVKAGVKFSDLRRIGKEAMVKAGMPEATIVVNPHSVGVEHGDNPMRDDLPFEMVEDLVLQENMVITADLASLDLGWGNLHHEDLIRITKTGFEPFPAVHEPFVII